MGLAIAAGALGVLLPVRLTIGAMAGVLLGAIYRILRVAFSLPCVVHIPSPCLFQHALYPSQCFAKSRLRLADDVRGAQAEARRGVSESRKGGVACVRRRAVDRLLRRRQRELGTSREPDRR
jgi:hypothetical protein